MKNIVKILGIAIIIALALFTITTCDNGTGGSGNNGDGDGGNGGGGNGGNGGGNNTLSGNVTITGTPTAGQLLTAAYSGNENVTFQWKRGSANVESGTKFFRPLRIGELTVIVSAAGYASKSATVTVGGSNIDMFWWGNYCPQEGTHSNVSATTQFNLNELVANRDNARLRRSLPAGQQALINENNVILNQDGTIYGVYNSSGVYQGNTTSKNLTSGTLRWQEYKSSEVATKVDKTIGFTSCLGFMYFISPESFGNIIVRDVANVDVTFGFPKHTATIDGVSYNIYRRTDPMVVTDLITFTFDFN